MAAETYLVAYEGDGHEDVLDYAIEKARRDGAKLLVAHVLEWSPYSFLTAEELAERHKRRREEMARAQAAVIDPAVAKAAAAGVEAAGELRYGSVVNLVVEIATESGAAMIFVGRSGGGAIEARVFGSAPLGIAQIAPVPTVIVP